MRITFIFIAALFLTGCASDFIGSAVRMTPEEERVHTISDTTGCEFITTTITEEAAQHVHTYIKKRVVASGVSCNSSGLCSAMLAVDFGVFVRGGLS